MVCGSYRQNMDITDITPTPIPADEDWGADDERIVTELRAEQSAEQLTAKLGLLEQTDIHLQAARRALTEFNADSDISGFDELIEEAVGARRYYTEAAKR